MAPGFWSHFFRRTELTGVTLDWAQCWEISAPPRPLRLASAIRVLLSEDGVVVLEGLSIDPEVEQSLQRHLIAPALEIQPGTLYPTSKWLHVRASADALKSLNELANSFADPEVCNHMYGYEKGSLLLEWHDAFEDPIHVAGTVSPAVITSFCSALGVGPAKPPTRPIE